MWQKANGRGAVTKDITKRLSDYVCKCDKKLKINMRGGQSKEGFISLKK